MGRGRPPKPKIALPAKKICTKCNSTKLITDFYNHRDWQVQNCKDAWCKDCVYKFCKDEATLQEYCWYNNRAFNKELFDNTEQKALYKLNNNIDFVSDKTKPTTKAKMLMEERIHQYLTKMHLKLYYRYVNNIDMDGVFEPFNANNNKGFDLGKVEPEKEETEASEVLDLPYNEKWVGHYSAEQVAKLEEYFSRLNKDFELYNENLRDFARNIAKASLEVEKAWQDYRAKKINIKDLQDVIKIFDSLSQSANFAECKRKNTESSDLGSFGELVYLLESDETQPKPKVKFERDDIDAINEAFGHLVTAIGAKA